MNVFVYGTLTDSDTAARVLSTFEYRGEAKLVGLQRVDGDYPTLVPGDSVEGRILRTPDVAALDRYEGVDRDLYVRVSVPRDCDSVATYVGDPDRLNVEATRGSEPVWPGDGPFAERVRRYLAEHEVVVRVDTN